MEALYSERPSPGYSRWRCFLARWPLRPLRIGSRFGRRTSYFSAIPTPDARETSPSSSSKRESYSESPFRPTLDRTPRFRSSSSPSETELICGCFSPDSRASFPSVCFVAHPISTALRFGWMNRRSNAFTRSITSTTIFFFTPRWRARRFGSRKGSPSSGRQWKRDVTGAWRSGVPTRVIFERFGSDR